MKGARGAEGMQPNDIEQGCKALRMQLRRKDSKQGKWTWTWLKRLYPKGSGTTGQGCKVTRELDGAEVVATKEVATKGWKPVEQG